MNAEESNMTDDAVLSDGVLVDDADVASGDNKVLTPVKRTQKR